MIVAKNTTVLLCSLCVLLSGCEDKAEKAAWAKYHQEHTTRYHVGDIALLKLDDQKVVILESNPVVRCLLFPCILEGEYRARIQLANGDYKEITISDKELQ